MTFSICLYMQSDARSSCSCCSFSLFHYNEQLETGDNNCMQKNPRKLSPLMLMVTPWMLCNNRCSLTDTPWCFTSPKSLVHSNIFNVIYSSHINNIVKYPMLHQLCLCKAYSLVPEMLLYSPGQSGVAHFPAVLCIFATDYMFYASKIWWVFSTKTATSACLFCNVSVLVTILVESGSSPSCHTSTPDWQQAAGTTTFRVISETGSSVLVCTVKNTWSTKNYKFQVVESW